MNPPDLDRPLRAVRLCLHLLVLALLVLAATRALLGHVPHAPAVLVACVVMAAAYAAGPLLPRVGSSLPATGAWLVGLSSVWLVLLWLSPDGVWLAFPLFFVQLHLLPRDPGLVAVVATTLAAIGGFAMHQEALTPAGVIGPALGAAVAVATVLGYQALHAESERRRELIGQLTSTRNELAAVERSEGELAERERLVVEIHDTLAQGLSSIQLLLRAAERALPSGAETAADYVGQARHAAEDNLTEARRFVRALAPADLERESLPAALDRLCAATGQQAGLSVHFHLSGTPAPVPTPYEVAVLRIAQSALANTVRHAHASRVEVTLTYMDTRLALDTVDDGLGFDAESMVYSSDSEQANGGGTSAGGGFGLAAMRARVRSLGGTLSVESTPGEGTALAVSFPYEQEVQVS